MTQQELAALRAACEAGYIDLVEYLEVYESIYPRPKSERPKPVLVWDRDREP